MAARKSLFDQANNLPDYGATDRQIEPRNPTQTPITDFDRECAQLCDDIYSNISTLKNKLQNVTHSNMEEQHKHAEIQTIKKLSTTINKDLNYLAAKVANERQKLDQKMKSTPILKQNVQTTNRSGSKELQSLTDAKSMQQDPKSYTQNDLEFQQALLLEQEKNIQAINSTWDAMQYVLSDIEIMIPYEIDRDSIEDLIPDVLTVEADHNLLLKARYKKKLYIRKLILLAVTLIIVIVLISAILTIFLRP